MVNFSKRSSIADALYCGPLLSVDGVHDVGQFCGDQSVGLRIREIERVVYSGPKVVQALLLAFRHNQNSRRKVLSDAG